MELCSSPSIIYPYSSDPGIAQPHLTGEPKYAVPAYFCRYPTFPHSNPGCWSADSHFGANADPIVPYSYLNQHADSLAADCYPYPDQHLSADRASNRHSLAYSHADANRHAFAH
jgi:hypothetical protein